MPYVVIVYAPDRATANHLTEAIDNNADGARPVGLYRFPSSKDVECPGWRCPHVTNKRYGYGRDARYAHIVHGACGRREKGFRARVSKILMDTFGINLLPRDTTPAVFRNPEGYDLH